MVMLTSLAFLLILNMILNHGYKLILAYRWIYRKIKKPKFQINELVMIGDVEFQILAICATGVPYTYFCLQITSTNVKIPESYFHESKIKKKTGLLKELE